MRPCARRLLLAAWLALPFASGCALPARAPNPSFSIAREDARADLGRMAADPAPLVRPLVILAGTGDPDVSSSAIRRLLLPALAGPTASVDFFDEFTFAGCRQKLFREVARQLACPIDAVPEVDVVAFSMGGLVAREAAIPDAAGRRLRIRRLYTIATPHQGARMAGMPLGVPLFEDMRPTSDLIARLRRAPIEYELVCYARLDDPTVGEEFAAPEGVPLWWVPTPSGEWAHMAAFSDPRILADVARRLRGEEPHARAPAAPLPN